MSSAVYAIVPRTIASFAKKHVRARLDMQVHATERQLELLTSRRIDIALLRPPRIVSGLETREICREGFVAVIHEASPLANLQPLMIEELKGENFIGFNEIRGIGYWDIVRQHCRASGFLPKIVQRVSHTTGVVTLVAAGLGVGIVPAWVVNEPIRGVCYRKLDELPPAVSLVCAWRPDTMNPLVAPFVAELMLNKR